ncbi:MAG: Crp/Fnr family transcriptional regulator [Bacteroidales bacterium]|nr:Crp/Fnr family transcriptional regulator [Bacteroidales bacterium]
MIQTCNCENCELKELFFHNVTEDEIKSLCTSKVEKNYDKGNFIIKEGEEIKEFIYLKSGLVKLYRTLTGKKEQVITIAKPFDFVSILSVFSDKYYNYSVTALEESVTCVIDMNEVQNLILENGKFARDVLEKMSRISDKIILESLEIRRRNLKGRVAFILLYFANTIYQSQTLELPVSRKEIAEYIGMTTENVIRCFTEFRRDNILKINGKIIEISDLKRLEQISKLG